MEIAMSGHRPIALSKPWRVTSRLSVRATEAFELHAEDIDALGRLSTHWSACLEIDQLALDRLFLLWNTLQKIAADEVSDWSLSVMCRITSEDGIKPPPLLGVSATVFANGEVLCAVTIDGIDPALQFVEAFDLLDLEASGNDVHAKAVQA